MDNVTSVRRDSTRNCSVRGCSVRYARRDNHPECYKHRECQATCIGGSFNRKCCFFCRDWTDNDKRSFVYQLQRRERDQRQSHLMGPSKETGKDAKDESRRHGSKTKPKKAKSGSDATETPATLSQEPDQAKPSKTQTSLVALAYTDTESEVLYSPSHPTPGHSQAVETVEEVQELVHLGFDHEANTDSLLPHSQIHLGVGSNPNLSQLLATQGQTIPPDPMTLLMQQMSKQLGQISTRLTNLEQDRPQVMTSTDVDHTQVMTSKDVQHLDTVDLHPSKDDYGFFDGETPTTRRRPKSTTSPLTSTSTSISTSTSTSTSTSMTLATSTLGSTPMVFFQPQPPPAKPTSTTSTRSSSGKPTSVTSMTSTTSPKSKSAPTWTPSPSMGVPPTAWPTPSQFEYEGDIDVDDGIDPFDMSDPFAQPSMDPLEEQAHSYTISPAVFLRDNPGRTLEQIPIFDASNPTKFTITRFGDVIMDVRDAPPDLRRTYLQRFENVIQFGPAVGEDQLGVDTSYFELPDPFESEPPTKRARSEPSSPTHTLDDDDLDAGIANFVVHKDDTEIIKKSVRAMLVLNPETKKAMAFRKAPLEVPRADEGLETDTDEYLKTRLPIIQDIFTWYDKCGEEVQKPTLSAKASPYFPNATKKIAKLYSFGHVVKPEQRFLNKPREAPLKFDTLSSFKSQEQVNKAHKEALTLPPSVFKATDAALRAGLANANYLNHFAKTAKYASKNIRSNHNDLKRLYLRTLATRGQDGAIPTRHLESLLHGVGLYFKAMEVSELDKEGKQLRTDKLDALAQLLSGTRTAAFDLLSPLVTIDTNLVLAQRDRLLDKLSDPLERIRPELRQAPLTTSALFQCDNFQERAKEEVKEQVNTLLYSKLSTDKDFTHPAVQRGGGGYRGRGNRGNRGQPRKPQNPSQPHQPFRGGRGRGGGGARGGYRGGYNRGYRGRGSYQNNNPSNNTSSFKPKSK